MLSKDLRPKTLEEMIGQKMIKMEFKNRSIKKDFPDVMIFEGFTGSGKSTSAMIVSKILNCKSPIVNEDKSLTPCNECAVCKDINEERYTRDVIFRDASSMGKEDVLALQKEVGYAPRMDENKIIIIEEAHLLSKAGKGATLKLLEKQRKNIFFILCTSKIELFEKDVKTRGVGYKFKKVVPSEIAKYLFSYVDKLPDSESIPDEFFDKSLFLIADASEGSIRGALQLLERCLYGKLYNPDKIVEELGLMSADQVSDLLYSLLNKEGKAFSDLQELDLQEFFYKSRKILESAIVLAHAGKLKDKWKEKNSSRLKDHKNFFNLLSVFSQTDEVPYFKPYSFLFLLNKFYGGTVPILEKAPPKRRVVKT